MRSLQWRRELDCNIQLIFLLFISAFLCLSPKDLFLSPGRTAQTSSSFFLLLYQVLAFSPRFLPLFAFSASASLLHLASRIHGVLVPIVGLAFHPQSLSPYHTQINPVFIVQWGFCSFSPRLPLLLLFSSATFLGSLTCEELGSASGTVCCC